MIISDIKHIIRNTEEERYRDEYPYFCSVHGLSFKLHGYGLCRNSVLIKANSPKADSKTALVNWALELLRKKGMTDEEKPALKDKLEAAFA